MIDRTPSSPKPISERIRKARKPAAIALAGALGLGMLGLTLTPHMPYAIAQQEKSQDTIMTPHGRAPATFADLVENVRGAVVSIQVKNGNKENRLSQNSPELDIPDLPDGHPLKEFFERFRKGMPDNDTPQRPTLGQGSGFFVSKDGYVVTNNHVVSNGTDITVVMDNGDEHKAKVVGLDERTDLALLKIDADKTFPVVEFSDKPARVGDWVLAVGNPFGLGGTVTAGIVSAHNRDIGSGPYDYLQLDAAVNRGNSGGPAFNLEGKVVGVNTAIFSPSGGNVGIAFAVPSELAQKVVSQLRTEGKVERGWLGVTIQSVNEDIAASLGLDKPRGALVTTLVDGSPAAKSDIQVGDLIVGVDGEKIDDSRDLARKIAGYDPNKEVNVTVIRDGEEREVGVNLGTFPSEQKLADIREGKKKTPSPASEPMGDLGLSLAPAESQPGAGGKGVVVTSVDPDSRAADKGIKAGDIILEVAGNEVNNPGDVAKGVAKARDKGRAAVHMLVRSGERQRFVAIPLKKA